MSQDVRELTVSHVRRLLHRCPADKPFLTWIYIIARMTASESKSREGGIEPPE
jgi:hypothetical protein